MSSRSYIRVRRLPECRSAARSSDTRRFRMSLPSCQKRALPATTIQSRSSKHPRLGSEPWASLPEDLLELIGWRVLAGDLIDYVRFRAVCTHWSSSTAGPRGRGLTDPRFHPRRWMLLPEGHGLYPGHPNLGGHVRFFNLSTGAFVRVHLPLFDDHIVLDSADGLLLLLRHPDTAVRLLHPFTGEIAELPPLSSLLPQIDPDALRRMTDERKLRKLGTFLSGLCAAVTVSAAAGVIGVMLCLDMVEIRRVAYAAAGDHRWALSAWKLPLPPLLTQTASFQGKLYAVSSLESTCYQDEDKAYIYRIDPPQPNAEGSPHTLSPPPPPPGMIAECPPLETMSPVHLVECDSELMLVGYRPTSSEHLVVYRLADLTSGRVVPVTDIGEHALFLGERGVCVSKNKGFPCVPGNSVVCINRWAVRGDPWQCCSRVEQYHLGSGTWSPAIEEDILCLDTPPVSPYMLLHHIFTCCVTSYWNKGLIFCSALRPIWSVKPNLWLEG